MVLYDNMTWMVLIVMFSLPALPIREEKPVMYVVQNVRRLFPNDEFHCLIHRCVQMKV